MGRPIHHYWHDPFVDFAWFVKAAAGFVLGTAPVAFCAFAADMHERAVEGVAYKKSFTGKRAETPVEKIADEVYRQIHHYLPNSDIVSDLARFMGAGYIHEPALEGIASLNSGSANYRV